MAYFPFLQPDFSERKAVRPTFVNTLGQHIMTSRKEAEVWHTITYSYSKITTRMYRIIDDFFRTVNGRVTTFYVVDWGDPKIVKAIAGADVTVNNIGGLTSNSGDGGNRVVLWKNAVEMAYGNDSTVSGSILTDPSKSWTTNEWQNHSLMDTNGTEIAVSSNTANTITLSSAPDPGAYDLYRYEAFTISSISGRVLSLSGAPVMSYSDTMSEFIMPVYTCRFMSDSLDELSQDGTFNKESNDNYGPYFSGEISFIQAGTGT